MKIKCLAVIGALLLAGPASAATFTLTEDASLNPGKNKQVTDTQNVFTLLAGAYDFTLKVTGTGNSTGSLTATLIRVGTNWTKFLTLDVGQSDKLSFTLESFGEYKIDWAGIANGGNVLGQATLQGKTVAVPGPEAGAGIGALAMAGLAYAVTRRRKLSAAA